jgi:hypothetical protein
MLVYTAFALCFVTLRGVFYAFSGTNLLTSCHSASSMFSAVLCFRKATQEIFSELDETKAERPIFLDTSQSPKMRRRGARDWPHPRAARPSPSPRHQGVRPPGPPPSAALPPIYCKPPPLLMRDREGPEALPGTLPERGIPAEGLLHHHGRLRSDVWVVYLGLRVHSSS